MSYRFSPQAEADLEAIADYIAEFNPGASVKLIVDVTRRLELLATQPFSGSTRDDVLPNLRHVVIGQYVAFYRVDDRIVVVLGGRVVGEVPGRTATAESIGLLMTGQRAETDA